jgi:hypothetical protein
MIGTLYEHGRIAFQRFERQKQWTAQPLIAHYGSLDALINRALDEELALAQKRIAELAKDMHPLGNYQFYALLKAFRNARSHFRCRPLEHDRELEPSATFLWIFFLAGLQSLIRLVPPVYAQPSSASHLLDAAIRRRLPTSNFLDDSQGADFCSRVICRFGHLLNLGILDVCAELKPCADYALMLAHS